MVFAQKIPQSRLRWMLGAAVAFWLGGCAFVGSQYVRLSSLTTELAPYYAGLIPLVCRCCRCSTMILSVAS